MALGNSRELKLSFIPTKSASLKQRQCQREAA